MRTDNGIMSAVLSYWKVLRIFIVVFFLFLTSDAFFRWDGFKYYAEFSEFIPSVALISILWSILALFTAFLAWGVLMVIESFSRLYGRKISIDHSMLTLVIFILLSAVVWKNKQFISDNFEITNQVRLIVMTIVTMTTLMLSYMLKGKAMNWMGVIHERITPLVWLFVAIIFLSLPLAAYHTWIKLPERAVLQEEEKAAAANKDRPNIILVTFDALTSRDMSAYGYDRPTTPFIDRWAKNASLFTRHKSASITTTPTTATLMTGKRLWTHQTFHLKGSKPLRIAEENMPLLLMNNGYLNMAFIANGFASVNVLGIEDSYNIAPIPSQFSGSLSLFGSLEKRLHYLFGEKIRLHDWLIQEDFILYRILQKFSRDEDITSTPPEKVFKKFLWTIDKNPDKPFFAWIHLYPPHDPYLPPKPFKGMFNASQKMSTKKSQYKVKNLGLKYKHSFRDFPEDVKPTMALLRDRYDEFIRYCDSQFEDFITTLSKSGILENTVIILSSDHGESFEHGSIQHSGLHLFEQSTHIPLIIKEPNQKKGLIINELADQVDVPATILELANIEIPQWMEGRSLVPLLRGKSIPKQPVFSMTLMRNPVKKQITKGTFALWEGNYKMIYYLEHDKYLLFNLRTDPDELINLMDSNPEGQRMLDIIKDNLVRANEKIKRENSK